MEREIEKKLEIIEEAIQDWRKGELPSLSALIAISITIDNRPISDECMKWAMKVAKKHMEDNDV